METSCNGDPFLSKTVQVESSTKVRTMSHRQNMGVSAKNYMMQTDKIIEEEGINENHNNLLAS